MAHVFRIPALLLLVALALSACGGDAPISTQPTAASVATTVQPAATPSQDLNQPTAASVATAVQPAAPSPSDSDLIIFQDDFAGADGYLGTYKESDGYSRYENGVYKMVVTTGNSLIYGATRNQNPGNAAARPEAPKLDVKEPSISLDVDVTSVSAADSDVFGVACGFAGPGGFTSLSISPDGTHYAIAYFDSSRNPSTTLLAGQERGQPHPAIKRGNGATNHLHAECSTDTIALTVNGQKLLEAPSNGTPGGVALLTIKNSNHPGNVEADFDNLVVHESSAAFDKALGNESGRVIFQDDFSDPNSGRWLRGNDEGSSYDYADGGYRIAGNDFTRAMWSGPGYGDVRVDVDVEVSKTPDSDSDSFGVICRHFSANQIDNYYAFDIGSDGFYGIYKIKGDELYRLGTRSFQPSAIQTGKATNHVRADCVGPTLTLSVNGQQLLTVRDTEFSSGGIGLEAYAHSKDQETDLRFDNLVVSIAPSDPIRPVAAIPAPSGGSGKLLFEDDFATAKSGWASYQGLDALTGYVEKQGVYRFALPPKSMRVVTARATNARDVRVNVDGVVRTGQEGNDFGLACRIQDDKNYYRLVIGSDGFYGITRINDGEPTWLAKSQLQLSGIKNGKEVNHIQADCVGKTLTLSVNGAQIISVEDAAFSSGGVGLTEATAEDKGSLDVVFDNFSVREP